MNNLREEDNSYQSDQDSLNSSDKEGPISDTKNRMIKEEEGQPEPENTTICVRVKTMDEQEKRFQMSLEDKISDLKTKILDDLEIPIERQRLIYMGKQLKDNLTLLECKLKDDSCILLVANRAQNRNEPPRRAPENQEQSSQNDGEFGAFLLNALNESAQMRRNRRLLFQQNASSFLRNIRLNINESREAITQNIASTQLLLDTRTEVEELKTLQPDVSNSMNCFDFEKRHLKVGQWVDVKDTINQWLEAQVVEIRDNRAYVHYNGWGTRWDEWIQIDSPRIALFRTHTIQAATSQYLSPCPNNPPDSAENVSLRTENDTNLDNLEKVIELSSKSLSLMKKLKSLKKKYNKRVKLQKEKKYQATSKALEKIHEESKSELAREEMKEEIDKEDEEFERMNFKEMATENSLLNQQIMILSGQLAPIMDRVGRMYTDFSPHLLHSVNNYNGNINSSNVNNRDRNTHENAERSRTHHPRRRERLRSEDSEESSDDDFSRRDSDESDNEDRDNTQQEGQQRDRREDSHEIRNRLRSISSTISRIRSSISSMRSLIFNNVEEDNESNNNESRNEEREERNVAVNAQIPVISSPGDIASVHSRLNRFINGLTIDQGSLDRMLDRQAMNGMETEGFISSLANRNNPGQNSNGSRNPRDDSGNNPTENRQENPSQNNGERINREGQRRNQNTEINHDHNHIHDHHHHTSPNLFDLLGPAGNGRGGLGILGNNLGGLGDASDTIEFHIHAFMPNSNGPSPLAPRQPDVPLPRPENHLPPFAPQIPPLQAQMPPPELQAPPIGEPQRPELVDASTSADPPQMRSTSVQTEGIRIRRDRRERNRENGTTFNKNPFSR